MIWSKSRLGDKNIVSSGVIVGSWSDVICVYPFEKNPDFALVIKHKALPANQKHTTNTYISGENEVTLEVAYSWGLVNAVTVLDTIFASTDKYIYGINIYFGFVGAESAYTYNFSYAVYEKAV